MEREWMRLFAAVALSVMLPQLIVGIGSRLAAQKQPEDTVCTTASSTVMTTEPTQAAQTFLIPVLTDEGLVQMELEEYVRGVVLAEMPAYFEEEALKAQAVVARTYALRRIMTGDRHKEGAVCTESVCCQAWLSDIDYLAARGGQADWEKIASAVTDTAGEILTYQGTVIDATYFSCSGGRTEDAAAVWGTDIPYLQAVDSPGEEGAGSYEKQVYFTKVQFAALLGQPLTGSPAKWLGEVTYTEGGGVATMLIGGVFYTGKELRKLLGLNSTAFTMEPDSGGITVTTWGRGHRVGMSQYGADAMAVTGSGYGEILAHYYRGTEIDKLIGME